jgi:hypothetical protein
VRIAVLKALLVGALLIAALGVRLAYVAGQPYHATPAPTTGWRA